MPVKNPFRAVAISAARAADDKKALDVVVLDVHAASDVTDYVVIASAESSAQLSAIESAVEEALKEKGYRPIRRDGRARNIRPSFSGGGWLAIDYGAVFVHILLTDAREFYRLDQLWETAKQVKWEKA